MKYGTTLLALLISAGGIFGAISNLTSVPKLLGAAFVVFLIVGIAYRHDCKVLEAQQVKTS